MFKQFIRKFSTEFKPIYSSKEYIDLYINNSKYVVNILHKELESKVNMQNKVIFGSIAGVFGAIYWSVDKNEEQFKEFKKETNEQFKQFKEETDKQFKQAKEETDKQFKQAKEETDKQFKQAKEETDKRFEHLEKDIGEIKSILKEMNAKKSWFF
jgi:DNA anti-recombination protein RmuC